MRPMDKKDILKNIIQHEGSCSAWADSDICSECPLSKLKQREDDNYLSCVEAVGIEGLTIEEADKRYKEVAEHTLADVEIQSILEDNNDITQTTLK
jgi:hypothetical protein